MPAVSPASLSARLLAAIAPVAALIAVLALTSCGAAPVSTAITCTSNTSTATSTTSSSTCTDPVANISITISPATVSVNVVTEQQFFASLSGGTNSIVTWQVNSKPGGDDTVGTIDANGLYHAPVQQPSPNTVTVAAVSFEDSKLSASSTVTITPAPTITISGTSTYTSPSTTCMNASTSATPSAPPPANCTLPAPSGTANSISFTGSETGGTTGLVTWSVGPVGGLPIEGGNSNLGTISANGVYRPPATPPVGQIVTVTASAGDCPNIDTCSSTAALNVLVSGYTQSSLAGQFAFSLSGSNAAGHFFRAGSFTADATGRLTNVIEDADPAPGGVGNPIITNGSYTVGADGRGTLSFNDGLAPATFDFVLVNAGQLQIIGFDASGTSSGQAVAQDASTFSGAPLSALNGTYVFDFSGVHGAHALSEIGVFSADGAGNITQGSIDTNDGGATSAAFQIFGAQTSCKPSSPPAMSSYTIGPNGRGTLTLNTVDSTCSSVGPSYVLTFYVATRGLAKFVGTDPVLQVGGSTSLQTPGATLSASALSGSYAFLLSGSASGGPITTAGNFVADGAGHLTSGILDENVNGTPAPSQAFQPNGSNVGTYTVASNGRGTLTFTTAGRTYTFTFCLGSVGANTTAVFQETDSGIASVGVFALQQSAAFTIGSITGNYAISTSGASGGVSQVITGQLAMDGAGATKPPSATQPASAVDVNTGGTLNAGQAVTGAYTAPAASGRATLSLTPVSTSYAAYVVNSTEVFLLDLQPAQMGSGILLRQF